MQLRNAKTAATATAATATAATASTSSTGDLTSRLSTRRAAQIDSAETPDSDSDFEPKNVYWSQSNSRQSKIFDEYFEKNQYPSKIELEHLAKKACVSLQCVKNNFYSRRKRAQKMVASGARMKLPTQMKRLQGVVKDKSVKYRSQSQLRQTKIFDKFFENIQFPSQAELEQLAEKTGVSIECVRNNFQNRRKRAHQMVASGERKELPTQMKRLQEVMADRSRKFYDKKELTDLKEELDIDECQLRNLLRVHSCSSLHSISHRELMARTQFPSKEQFKEEAKKTNRSFDQVRQWFYRTRRDIMKECRSGKRKELPQQMETLYEIYMEKEDITEKQLMQLSNKIGIRRPNIPTFFNLMRQMERKVGKKDRAVKDVSRLRSEEDSENESEEDSEDEDDEDSPSDGESSKASRRRRKCFSEDGKRDERRQESSEDSMGEDSEEEDKEDVDKNYQPCSFSYVPRNSRIATRSKQRIEAEDDESSDGDNEPPRKKRPAGRRQMERIREDEEEFDEMAEDWEIPPPNIRVGRSQGQTPDYDYNPPSPVSSDVRDHASSTTKGRSRSSSEFQKSRRQNRETTHKSRKRVEEDESEDEDSEDEDSLSRNRNPASKSRQRIKEEEDESSDDDNEPPRKKRPIGRRQMERIREDEDLEDGMAEDWELPPPNQRHGRSRGETQDIDYDHRSRVTRGVSRPSSFSRRRDQEGSRKSSRYVSSMETNEWLRSVLSGLSETRVEIHGRKFKDVVLPYNHSVDWENWTSAQTVQVATQLFPPRAVEFFKKSGVHSRLLSMFIDGTEGIYEGLEDHNEDGHFTRGMFDAFGDNIRTINELIKEKAAGTSSSSRSGYVQTSSQPSTSSGFHNGTFKAPSHPAPRNLPVSQNPTGPMRNWTDEQCLQLARQFVPKMTLAVFKKWGFGRQKLLKIAEKDEESFEQLRALDVALNDKETLTWRMFEEFGEYIRAMQVMEWKLREDDERQSSLPSRPPSTMSAPLSLQDIDYGSSPQPRNGEIKEEIMEQDEERVPATVLFTPRRSSNARKYNS